MRIWLGVEKSKVADAGEGSVKEVVVVVSVRCILETLNISKYAS